MTSYLAFTGRAVKRFIRTPETIISTVAFPVLLMLTLLAVFSSAVEGFVDGDYAQRLVPALVVGGVLFGSIGTAVALFTDIETGFMQRIRALPVPAGGPIVGSVLAEAMRATLAVVVLVAVGTVFGFRFDNGVPAAVGFFAVAALAAMSIAWVGLALASRASSQEALGPPLSALFLVMLFFSAGMVPLEAYPGWAQAVVRVNPATAYVTTLDRLATGGDVAGPLFTTVLWSVALFAVFGTLAVRGIRR